MRVIKLPGHGIVSVFTRETGGIFLENRQQSRISSNSNFLFSFKLLFFVQELKNFTLNLKIKNLVSLSFQI